MIALVLFTVFKQFDRTGRSQGNHDRSTPNFLDEVRAKHIKIVVTLQEGSAGGTEIIGPPPTDDKRC